MSQQRWSEACERNKAPILAILQESLRDAHSVLEVGSGTGQHAVHFARHLPQLGWQPTEQPESPVETPSPVVAPNKIRNTE